MGQPDFGRILAGFDNGQIRKQKLRERYIRSFRSVSLCNISYSSVSSAFASSDSPSNSFSGFFSILLGSTSLKRNDKTCPTAYKVIPQNRNFHVTGLLPFVIPMFYHAPLYPMVMAAFFAPLRMHSDKSAPSRCALRKPAM